MKSWIFKSLAAVVASLSLEATADCQKVYIPEENIFIRDKLIFVTFGEESVPIKMLSTDAYGIYIQKDDLPLGFWVCDNGHTNYPWSFVCSVCGLSR